MFKYLFNFIIQYLHLRSFEEVWKPVLGFINYMVSNLGRVKNSKTGKILKQGRSRGGYCVVGLRKNHKQKLCAVSRLVWEAFNGPIPEGMQVNHINEVKTDNRLENLNLMTPKENCNWGTRNKRMATKLKANPQLHIKNRGSSKPILQYDLNGNYLRTWPSGAEITRTLGFGNHVSAVCRGERNYAYGYIWKYKSA